MHMSASDLGDKSVEEIKNIIFEYKKDIFNLKLRSSSLSSEPLKQNHLFKKARKGIARAKTVLSKKQAGL